jgi:hypothetical protein
MYPFLKIFVIVLLALALIDWLADRDRRADTNIPNAKTAVGLAVILLLAAALAGIWTGIRDEIQVRKIERERRQAAEAHSPQA